MQVKKNINIQMYLFTNQTNSLHELVTEKDTHTEACIYKANKQLAW
jgi:hypothetical protein